MELMKEVTSLIESVQSNKILQRVQKKKDSGEIRSEEEYNTELRTQLTGLRELGSKSYFNFSGIPYSRAYSEYMNIAFEEILLDLQVAFFEANNIYAKIISHDTFFKKTVDEIERLSKRAKIQIAQAQLEAGSDNAYTKVITNNFSDNSDRILPGNSYYNEIYFDRITSESAGKQNDAEIKTDENILVLPRYSSEDVSISSVSIIETETTSSDYNLQSTNADISVLLNESNSDAWFYNVNSEDRLEKASLALEVDMGDKKEINSFSLTPSNVSAIEVESISYVDENGGTVNLISEALIINEKLTIRFPKVITSRIKLLLNQYSNQLIKYDKNSSEFSLEDLQRNKNITPDQSMLADVLGVELTDPTVKEIVGLSSNQRTDIRTLYNYMFGISNVSCSYSEFQPYAIYASRQEEVRNISIAAIETDEKIDTFISKETNLPVPTGSIEYSLYKVDYDGAGKLLRTKEINILPLNKDQVDQERLFYTSQNRVIPLRFLAHKSDGDGSHIKLYRNGEELIRGVDWRFADRINVVDDSDSDLTPGLESTKVEILHSSDILKYGVYYAEYAPRFILEENRRTLDRGTFYLSSGAISLPLDLFGTRIEKSHMFIKVIMRSNATEVTSSPEIFSYKLLLKEDSNE